MGKARAEIEISASDSKLAAGLARSRSTINTWASAVARGASAVMNAKFSLPKAKDVAGGGGFISHAFGSFAGGMMTRGVDAVRDAAGEVTDFERALVRYQIVANKSPESMNALRAQIGNVSKETGLARQSILAGAQSYLDLTGDVEGTTKAVSTFGRVAQASDTQMSDVAAAAAAMQDAMHVRPEDFETAFSALIAQGKAGAVTLRNMATEFPTVLSKMSRFGGTGVRGVAQVGAMFQVVRKGFGTAEEASTGLQAMLGGIIKHADRFQDAGVSVFDIGKDGTKTLKPISAILKQIDGSVLAKDPQLLNKAFGRGEGEQAYQMLKGHVDMLHQMEQAGYDAGSVQRDMMTYTTSDIGKLDIAMNKIKLTIAEAFTPERIQAFVNVVEKVGGVVSKIVSGVERLSKWLDENKPKTEDDQIKGHLDEGAKYTAQGKRNLADELEKQGKEMEDAGMIFSVLNSPIFKFAQLGGGKLPDFSAYGGGAQKSAAAQLRVEAAVQEARDARARELNDPWNQASGKEREAIIQKGLGMPTPVDFQDQARGSMAPVAADKAMVRDLANAVGAAVANAMSNVGVPTVKLGDDQVAKSVNKANVARAGGKGS